MKKLFLFFTLLATIQFVAMADITGAGYYRLRNYGSQRWVSMVDNHGSADPAASQADLHALQLMAGTEEIITDPASIFYITNIQGNQYDIVAQGVDFQSLVGNSVTINFGADGSADGQTLYRLYGTYGNYTKYISDGRTNLSNPEGYATIGAANNVNFSKWMVLPVSVTGDNYFATIPTVTANNKGYTSLFTSFAYKPYSSGVKAYYISRVGFGMAEMVEISGAVPPGSPVIIECAGQNASDNKMELVNDIPALPSNALTGVYFDYQHASTTNQVKYDPQTMRVLGTCSDGSLGFVTATDLEYIPANTTYLQVPAGSSPEFKCVSSSDFEANLPDTPEQIYLIGSFKDVAPTDDSFILTPQDDYTYTANFTDLPACENKEDGLVFTFYTAMTDNSLNHITPYSSTEDVSANPSTEISVPFSYGGDFSWVIPNWGGGDLSVTLNLQYQYVKLYSSSYAGIKNIKAGDDSLHYSNGTIYCDSPSDITVFNVSGQTMAKGFGNSMNVSNLNSGIYIVVANGKSLKIAVNQ